LIPRFFFGKSAGGLKSLVKVPDSWTMSLLRCLTLSTLVLLCGLAHADRSCLPDYTAMQEFYSSGAPMPAVKRLRAQNVSGSFETKVEAVIDWRDGELLLSFRFDPAFDGVSLPYNLYAVMVLRDGEVVSWNDFTSQCRGPGLGFYPGREIRLDSIKLPGRPTQSLQIMVWGRL
jgi:hypothetical protein